MRPIIDSELDLISGGTSKKTPSAQYNSSRIKDIIHIPEKQLTGLLPPRLCENAVEIRLQG